MTTRTPAPWWWCLGSSVAETLFGSTAGVVGQKVRLNGQSYKVIGVLASKGGTGFMNQDDQVFIPLSTALYRLVGGCRFRGSSVISQITIKASNSEAVDQVVDNVTLADARAARDGRRRG